MAVRTLLIVLLVILLAAWWVGNSINNALGISAFPTSTALLGVFVLVGLIGLITVAKAFAARREAA